MTTIYKTTQVTNYEPETLYYTERKLTPEEYRAEFNRGYPLKKNQKLITDRVFLSKTQAERLISEGAVLKYKN